MSSTNDSPALDLSTVSIQQQQKEIELSLDLSIGRGLGKSAKFQNSMEFVENSSSELTNVPVMIPNEGDTNLVGDLNGDPTGDRGVQVQRRREAKRKREEMLDERRMYQGRVSEKGIAVPEPEPEPNLVRNSSVGSNERKSFKEGEINSQNNETCNLRPVVLGSSSLNGSNRNFGEQLVTGTECSGKDSQETIVISPAENTSLISPAENSSLISPDIKPSVSQEADTSKVGTVIDPIPRQPTCESTNHTTIMGQTNPLDAKASEEPNSTSNGQAAVFKPPQMPYVSTIGNGPNGRRVTGFLYKYTNTEVSIVCVCHGSPFTPAEFVEHAGGINISHPLRHIMVIPSAFDDPI